ncbi:MBL fold metallo-hydrolase [Pelagibacterium montanilacus]|uniref:MBL fold metallo-hydrolase n=1 Tax=Pelagibacterium montanilacus TaxID=2185280 RepID=UPI000F8D3CE8|nr:MBL fold metallo-hydrolase [Pelagibacterium montanilacus]
MDIFAREADTGLAEALAAPPGDGLAIRWLGQAGFAIDCNGRRAIIDPYLSDSLAAKYRGTAFAHTRMMAIPVAPGDIAHVDVVLATHAHTDHMDPGTLPALLAANPLAVLVAPRAERAKALERTGVDPTGLVGIERGEALEVAGIGIWATGAAHETLETDQTGHHRFLGYGMRLPGGPVIYHSGDSIPFAGLVGEVAALGADLALLPVNGRDAERRANGVPGNFTIAEAVDLARQAGIGTVIGHHYGMFAFNTVPRADIEAVARAGSAPKLYAADPQMVYCGPSDMRATAPGGGQACR